MDITSNGRLFSDISSIKQIMEIRYWIVHIFFYLVLYIFYYPRSQSYRIWKSYSRFDPINTNTFKTRTILTDTGRCLIQRQFKVSDHNDKDEQIINGYRGVVPNISDITGSALTPLEYEISPAVSDEFSAVARLRVHVFFPQHIGVFNFQSRILEKLRQRVDSGSICLVARLTDLNQCVSASCPLSWQFGSLIGTIEVSPNDFYNTSMENVGSPRKLYAADLAVRNDCRRQGVASRLLRQVENFAALHYFDEIYLHVELNNSVARELYLKHGYVEIPMTENFKLFTEMRLQKPPEHYILLWKGLWTRPAPE